MSLSSDRKVNIKDKIQKLINTGYFDSHLSEISNALYKKGIFKKSLFCVLNDRHFPNILKTFTQRNKKFIEQEKRRKELKSEVKTYQLNEYKEAQFNAEIIDLLKSLNSYKNSKGKNFEDIKDENNLIVASYDKYKKQNKQKRLIRDKRILEDLTVKYNNDHIFTFDTNLDIYKDSPLTTTDSKKLMFYYIINRDRDKNEMSSKNNKKLNPKVWSEHKVNNLKEIKYMEKINRITQKKIIKGNFVVNNNNKFNNNDEEEDDESFEQKLQYKNHKFKNFDTYLRYRDKIKLIEERKKYKLDVENDKKEINTLDNLIKDTLSRNDRIKDISSPSFKNTTGTSFKFNSLEHLNSKGQTFYSLKNNMIPELNNKTKYFNSILNKNHLFKSSSYNTLKDFNKTKNSSLYSNKTSTNIFQQSTYYSNSTKNKNTFNQIKFNNTNGTNTPNNSNAFSRRSIKENTVKLQIFKNKLHLKNFHFNRNDNKRKTTFKIKCKSLEDLYENDIDNIYSLCKKILDNKKLLGNKNDYFNMIHKYIKLNTNYTISENKKNNLRDTIIFFNKFKNRLKVIDAALDPQKLKHLYQDDGKKLLKYADILDSNLVNIENELLYKVFKKKN